MGWARGRKLGRRSRTNSHPGNTCILAVKIPLPGAIETSGLEACGGARTWRSGDRPESTPNIFEVEGPPGFEGAFRSR